MRAYVREARTSKVNARFKRTFQTSDLPDTGHRTLASVSNKRMIQTHALNASDVQLQVCCVRGGGGRVVVVAVTSIGLPTLLKNEQMANVLDKVCESGKSCA